MDKKDNIFKFLARIGVIGLLIYSLYVFLFDETQNSFANYLFPVGFILSIFIGIGLVFILIGIGLFIITRFLNWAFNTDYFD